MDFNELKQKMDSITLELKAKALSLLVDSLDFMINVMLEMTSSVLMQSETQTEQIKNLIKKNDDLVLLTDELQETIRDLKSQLNQNSNNSSKPPSSDGYKKRSLRVLTGAKAGGQKGHKGAHLSVPRHLMRLNVIFLKNVSAVQISRHVLHQEMYLPVQSHVM